MKYLKKYNESNQNDIVDEIKDLLIDLEDSYHYVDVYKSDYEILVFLNNTGNNLFNISIIKTEIDTLIEYMFNNYYDVGQIILGFDNGRDIDELFIKKEEFNIIDSIEKYKYATENLDKFCITFRPSK